MMILNVHRVPDIDSLLLDFWINYISLSDVLRMRSGSKGIADMCDRSICHSAMYERYHELVWTSILRRSGRPCIRRFLRDYTHFVSGVGKD